MHDNTVDYLPVERLFGEGQDLTALQMGLRALVMFIVALILIRLSGRRSFGLKMPFDNVIYILLGAILSRAVTGSSPFFSVITAAIVIVLLHRGCAWIALYSDAFGCLIKGDSDILYKNGLLEKKKMKRYFITEKDLREEIRKEGNINDINKVSEIYIERDGCISVIKKEINESP